MTILYRWFTKMGIEWSVHEEIQKEINFVPGEIHNFRLNVYYGNRGRKHTRSFLDKNSNQIVLSSKKPKTYRDLFREKAIEMIGSKPALLLKNTKDNFIYPLNLTECPYNMEGLNEFRYHTTALMTGSFNQEGPYYALLKKLELEDQSASLHLYQFLMRLACREWDYRGTINLYIPCLSLFEEIGHLFNPNMVSFIPLGLEFEEAEDERKNNGNYNLAVPSSDWYEVEDKSKMVKNYGFPQRNSKGDYLTWFAQFGYKSTSIEKTYKTADRHTKVKKHLIVYKTESALEEAKKYFG